ncbi:hypothetical protein GYMLUDRAFT_168136 [Collybiopsis luxurians FD-317 M1]|uniref:Cytochrome P450 n=1 Tax=Collybiopsis luxurians FD-317 M1 TaxID=944289 RepID=A0A0D0CCN9_9AGAR|nr:hypothetical protein GYMLUDRAFT_168136 [Collybiopsis luxurians FD-317 M1]
MYQLLLPDHYGVHEFKWQEKYGAVYRIKGCFNENRLMISDPTALKYILNDPTTFERSIQQQEIVNMLIGEKAVFYVKGDSHRRIRNIMNTAFSPSNMRALPPVFSNIAEKLQTLREELSIADNEDNAAIDIYHTLHSATLDAVGEGAIGYQFQALDDNDSELGQIHQNIITMSGVRAKSDIIFEGIVPYIPPFLLRLALSFPSPAFTALRRNREVSRKVAKELVSASMGSAKGENQHGEGQRKDLISVMVRRNLATNASDRMSDEEMQQQIPSLMIAGQDTTGNTLSMAIYELGKDLALQSMIRKEVLGISENVQRDLKFEDLEKLPLMNAFLKEVLRMHPGLPMSDRVAITDTLLPLSEALVTTSGERITALPIRKGQHIIIATASYNRLVSVWGNDAHVFRPSRWLESGRDNDVMSVKGTALGPYAGLATFFGGPRVCLGWRFALTELQVLLSVLIRRFKFSLPDDKNKFIRPRLAVTLAPVREDGCFGLPVVVKDVDE